jgi:CBS domain containing-hemolysin-like protein
MPDPSTAALAAPPIFDLPLSDAAAMTWLAAALFISGALGLLHAALEHIPSSKVLPLTPAGRKRERLASLLSNPDPLLVSASLLKLSFELTFLALLLPMVATDGEVNLTALLGAIAIGVPCLLLFSEALPRALARRRGERVLASWLIPFHALQLPLVPIVGLLRLLRDAVLRASHMEESDLTQQQAVEELREVIEETGHTGELEQSEREMLENVIEFHDVDVSAVMTPRTEILGVEIGEGLPAALKMAVEKGLRRIPVYEGSLDTIVGYINARLVLKLLAKEELERADIRDHLQPALFVPETQRVSVLLADFREERQKMAIILDEYGGTSGLVTIGDVFAELVGELQDEFSDEDEPEEIRRIGPRICDIDGAARLDEVNEALELGLPEQEDYETLAGFILSELGRIPCPGDNFKRNEVLYEVTEASDRRVICVRVSY